jgi:hypothetical protein
MNQGKNIPHGNAAPGSEGNQASNLTPDNPGSSQKETERFSQLQILPVATGTQPQPTDMEVHKHPHHITHKKKWGEYLLEFLMLFLAVFLGFLAENFREHKVEKERGKQYIQSLYEDLKADTTRLRLLINYDKDKITGLSNMMACYDTVTKNLKSTSCMGTLIKYSKTNAAFQLTNRTLRQLANAGGFRLLSKEDADSILGYESSYRRYQNFETTVFQTAQDNVRNTLNELADFRVNAPVQNFTTALGVDTASGKLKGPLLFIDDRVLLNKWFNQLALYLRVTNGQQNILSGLKDKATGLILYYRNKYHLE